MKMFHKENLKAFINRRKANALGLLVMTFASAIITAVCALRGVPRTGILATITVLLVVLCLIQEIKLRRSFRTIHAFKGIRKKKDA